MAATLIGDMQLLGRLSAGDMVALEAKYHTNCLLKLYNRARSCKNNADNETNKDATISGIVLAELVMFLKEARYEENIAPVFKLADLVKLYESRLKQLQIETDEKCTVHDLKRDFSSIYLISEHITKAEMYFLSSKMILGQP